MSPSPSAGVGDAGSEGPSAHAFQVDLHGVVDLLARHLYSGPRVYLRELLQNAVDAITARRAVEPGCPAQVRIRCLDDGTLEVADTGIGLTREQAEELLATIGASSKRDQDLGTARGEYLGQFGIGLLSSFMVADEVELVSVSASGGAPVRWRGFADGSYTLATLPDGDDDVAGLPAGSRVRLRARPDAAHWVTRETVLALAEDVGGLLPVDIAVQVPVGERWVWRRVTSSALPWASTGDDRAAALARDCEGPLGFTPRAAMLPASAVADAVAYALTQPPRENVDELRISPA